MPVVTEVGWFHPTLIELEKRARARGVIAESLLRGGLHLDDVPERTEKPYGRLSANAVRGLRYTNKTKYADLDFDIAIACDSFEKLDNEIIPALVAAFQHAPIDPAGALNITMIRPTTIEYEKIEQIWEAVINFIAQANQPAVGTPS